MIIICAGRDWEERLTKYYSEERIAALAKINKRDHAHAKRGLFALVVVVRVRCNRRKFRLEQEAGRLFRRADVTTSPAAATWSPRSLYL